MSLVCVGGTESPSSVTPTSSSSFLSKDVTVDFVTDKVQGSKIEEKRNNVSSQDLKIEKDVVWQISSSSSSSFLPLSSSSSSSSLSSTSSSTFSPSLTVVSSVVGCGSDSDRSRSISPLPPLLQPDTTVQTAARTTGVSHIVGQRIGINYTPLPYTSLPVMSLVSNSSTHLIPSVSSSESSSLALLNNSDEETEGIKCVLLFETTDITGRLVYGSEV